MRPVEFCALFERGNAGPAYFLRGPDRFLHGECRTAVVSCLPAGVREWCFTEFEFKPGQFRRDLQNACQMPMLGGRSYLYWADAEDFGHATDDDFEGLAGYLKKPSAFSTVLFAAYQPDRRRRFIQCLEKGAEIVEVQPPGRPEATIWVRNYLRKAGVEISDEHAQLLAAKFEGSDESSRSGKGAGVNLLWLRTELEKLLVARSGARRIEERDLNLIVAVREEHEIGKMLAAVAERELSKALAVLQELVAGKQPETLILWCIGDLFRQALKTSSSPGQQYRGGWGGASNPYSTYEIAPRAARCYSREELANAIRLVHGADLAIKSSWKDSRLLLETLLWQIVTGAAAEGSAAWLEAASAGAPGS
jgi:DNA polymerase III delta subunit